MATKQLPLMPKKTGRPPQPESQGHARANVIIQEDMLEWAKHLPEGLSALVRKLLREEYERRRRP